MAQRYECSACRCTVRVNQMKWGGQQLRYYHFFWFLGFRCTWQNRPLKKKRRKQVWTSRSVIFLGTLLFSLHYVRSGPVKRVGKVKVKALALDECHPEWGTPEANLTKRKNAVRNHHIKNSIRGETPPHLAQYCCR